MVFRRQRQPCDPRTRLDQRVAPLPQQRGLAGSRAGAEQDQLAVAGCIELRQQSFPRDFARSGPGWGYPCGKRKPVLAHQSSPSQGAVACARTPHCLHAGSMAAAPPRRAPLRRGVLPARQLRAQTAPGPAITTRKKSGRTAGRAPLHACKASRAAPQRGNGKPCVTASPPPALHKSRHLCAAPCHPASRSGEEGRWKPSYGKLRPCAGNARLLAVAAAPSIRRQAPLTKAAAGDSR